LQYETVPLLLTGPTVISIDEAGFTVHLPGASPHHFLEVVRQLDGDAPTGTIHSATPSTPLLDRLSCFRKLPSDIRAVRSIISSLWTAILLQLHRLSSNASDR
jgi:hypothetical protein